MVGLALNGQERNRSGWDKGEVYFRIRERKKKQNEHKERKKLKKVLRMCCEIKVYNIVASFGIKFSLTALLIDSRSDLTSHPNISPSPLP